MANLMKTTFALEYVIADGNSIAKYRDTERISI